MTTYRMFPHHYELVTSRLADAWGRAKEVERDRCIHAYPWDNLLLALGGAFHAACAYAVMTPRHQAPPTACP